MLLLFNSSQYLLLFASWPLHKSMVNYLQMNRPALSKLHHIVEVVDCRTILFYLYICYIPSLPRYYKLKWKKVNNKAFITVFYKKIYMLSSRKFNNRGFPLYVPKTNRGYLLKIKERHIRVLPLRANKNN